MHIILLCTYTFFQDSYTVPLTSIQCWHVHCEECWLRTLVRWTFIILHLTKDVQHNHVTSTSEPCMLLSVVLIDKLSFSQGAKKLCPQCNTITSPGDLRRVYLWKVTAVLSSALTDHFNWENLSGPRQNLKDDLPNRVIAQIFLLELNPVTWRSLCSFLNEMIKF